MILCFFQDINVNDELVRRGFAEWEASSSQLHEDSDLSGKEVASSRQAVHGL